MDGSEMIGRGTHERALIDLARFAERLAAKFDDRG
jgi:predicted thioesterase